jgi:hypothetical protein
MVNKILSLLVVLFFTFATTFATTDLTQELDSKWGTLKVNNNLTINYQEGSFNETVVFNARTVSQLEWWIDSSKFDDKWSEVIYISFKNNIWLATIIKKDISLWFNNLENYKNPVLITYTNNKLVVLNWEDNAWTYVYKLNWAINGAYKIVDDLVWTKSDTTSTKSNSLEDNISLLWSDTNTTDNVELNSASEEPKQVLLSDKPVKWANDYYFLIIMLTVLLSTVLWFKIYKKS